MQNTQAIHDCECPQSWIYIFIYISLKLYYWKNVYMIGFQSIISYILPNIWPSPGNIQAIWQNIIHISYEYPNAHTGFQWLK